MTSANIRLPRPPTAHTQLAGKADRANLDPLTKRIAELAHQLSNKPDASVIEALVQRVRAVEASAAAAQHAAAAAAGAAGIPVSLPPLPVVGGGASEDAVQELQAGQAQLGDRLLDVEGILRALESAVRALQDAGLGGRGAGGAALSDEELAGLRERLSSLELAMPGKADLVGYASDH